MDNVPWQTRVAAVITSEREKLIGYVRRLIDDAAERDGEDIVQDVIVGIFSRADFSLPIENLMAYVYQSLRNRVVDALRKRKDMVSLDALRDDASKSSLLDLLPDPGSEAADPDLRLDIRRRLAQALQQLPPAQREVFVATEMEGRPFQELSERWQVPLGTLLARKSRAVKRIRQLLSDLEEQDRRTEDAL